MERGLLRGASLDRASTEPGYDQGMSALPRPHHALRRGLKTQMPEPNPQRSPVLWSGHGERTLIRKGEKKVMASISLNCFPGTRNGN